MSTIPNILGLNVSLALRQLGNNVKLYNKLLDQFQKTYAPAAGDISASVTSGDWETAERNAHTIKGLAGSLGATALQEVSAKLEKLCREHVSGDEYNETLAVFGREMDAAITAIRSYMGASEAPAAPATPAVNTALLASQLAAYDQQATSRIAAAFEVFDFIGAADVIAALRARLP